MCLWNEYFQGYIRDGQRRCRGPQPRSQKVLRDLRTTCLNDLKAEAYRVGADGVIGVALDYSEFSGAGTQMLFLVASGAAIKFDAQATQPP